MGKRTPLLNDFRSGEMTPGLGTRSDIKAYSKGCILMENCMPVPEGGVERTPGTRYVRPVKQTEEGWCLRVIKIGSGSGTVIGKVGGVLEGIDCGSVCYVFYVAGTTVVLTATADSGSTFKEWSGDGTGTTTRTVVMDGNKTVNAEFAFYPQGDHLVGWYKFDEESGLIVNNYAADGVSGGGLLPDLDVYNTVGDFWTYLYGFGSNPYKDTIPPYDVNWANAVFPSRNFGGAVNGYFTLGMFFRAISSTKKLYSCNMLNLGTSAQVPLTIYWYSQVSEFESIISERGTSRFPALTYSGGEWFFYYLTESGRLARVRSDGTRVLGSQAAGPGTPISISSLTVGVNQSLNGFGCQGSFGDVIIYNFTTLTDTEWAQWYDQLRSRYGMAARNGW